MAGIPTTKVFGPKPTDDYVQGGDAASVGLQAKQHGASSLDVPTGAAKEGRRFLPGDAIAPADVEIREANENQRTLDNARKIAEIAGIAHSPQQRAAEMRRKFAEAGMADIMDPIDPFEMGQIKQAQRPQQQFSEAVDDGLGVPEIAAPKGAWTVDSLTATTKTGAKIPVWQVRDGNSGMKLPHPFRLAETASKVQAVLNRTGNANDPRIGQWIGIDKQRQATLNKARQLKEAVNAGNKAAVQQLAEAREALAELDLKIGI
jgi:hypothetical protein